MINFLLHKHCGKYEIPNLAHLHVIHFAVLHLFACLKKFCNIKGRYFRQALWDKHIIFQNLPKHWWICHWYIMQTLYPFKSSSVSNYWWMHFKSIGAWCNFLQIIWSRLSELTFSHFIKTNIFNMFYISKVYCFHQKFQCIFVVWINRFGHVSKLDECFCQIVFLFTFHPIIKKMHLPFPLKLDTVSHTVNAQKYGNALQTSMIKCSINDKRLYHVGFGVTSWKYKLNELLFVISSIAL